MCKTKVWTESFQETLTNIKIWVSPPEKVSQSLTKNSKNNRFESKTLIYIKEKVPNFFASSSSETIHPYCVHFIPFDCPDASQSAEQNSNTSHRYILMYSSAQNSLAIFSWILDMAFFLLHAQLQLPSIVIADVTAVGMINRLGLMLPPYEAWCSAPTDDTRHCAYRVCCQCQGIMNSVFFNKCIDFPTRGSPMDLVGLQRLSSWRKSQICRTICTPIRPLGYVNRCAGRKLEIFPF